MTPRQAPGTNAKQTDIVEANPGHSQERQEALHLHRCPAWEHAVSDNNKTLTDFV